MPCCGKTSGPSTQRCGPSTRSATADAGKPRKNNLRRGLCCLLGGARILVLPLKAVDASGRVHQLLAPGEERVAGRADFHADIALMSRARLEGMAASARDVEFVIRGMNTSLHVAGIPFEIQYTRKTGKPRGLLRTHGAGSLRNKT